MPHSFHLNHILAKKVETLRVVPLYTTGTLSLEVSIPSPRVFLSCFVLWGRAIFLKGIIPITKGYYQPVSYNEDILAKLS